MLNIGDKAPDFTLPDQNGDNVSLKNYSGRKVVLWFFPKASTPGWTTEGQGFRDESSQFEQKNIAVIGMSADSVKRQKNVCDKESFSFPILSDQTKEVLKAYGAWGMKKMYGREYEGIYRYTYIIDENGVIEKAFSKVSTKTHAQDVLAELNNI